MEKGVQKVDKLSTNLPIKGESVTRFTLNFVAVQVNIGKPRIKTSSLDETKNNIIGHQTSILHNTYLNWL